MIVSDQQWKKGGTLYELETVRMHFQPNQQQISSLVLSALSIRSTIVENLAYSKKISAAQKWFVCVAKKITVKTHKQTNTNLAAKSWIKELLKTVVMVPCTNIARFWKNSLIYHQPIEVFIKYNMLSPHMSKQRKSCYTFIPKEKFNKAENTLVFLIYKYR